MEAEPLKGRRILVAYSNSSMFTTTTHEYVDSFRRHGSAEVHYLHVTHDAVPVVDLNQYDAVLLSYCARLCFPGYVSERFLRLLDRYDGVRAIAIQDEYDLVENELRGLDRLRPHVVFTCVPGDQRERVYPSARYPRTSFVQVLTGYVSSTVDITQPRRPVAQRPIAIGYRGRDIALQYGALAKQKYEIGLAVGAEAVRRGIEVDIRMDEGGRIYGDAWYRWLAACRCVLGTESGSNVFDHDGTIAAACKRAGSDATTRDLPEAIRRKMEKLDQEFNMGQASARIFEAAIMGTPLLLYRGRYSDAVQPDIHYIPLEHDHSNWEEVFARLSDVAGLQAMADRTHHDLVASQRYCYSAFVSEVERSLAAAIGSSPMRSGAAPAGAPMTDPNRPASEERPTTRPREFDSFQLRALRMATEFDSMMMNGRAGLIKGARLYLRAIGRRIPFLRSSWRGFLQWRAAVTAPARR